MRYYVSPYEKPYERDRWAVMDGECERLVVHTNALHGALVLTRHLNVNMPQTPAATGGRENLHGESFDLRAAAVHA